MAFDITTFRASLAADGARPNLFQVNMTFPGISGSGSETNTALSFMAKATSLPGSDIGIASQSYFGREVKFAGNRRFADWSITVINDETFIIRDAMERWMNSINTHANNVRNAAGLTPSSYTTDAKVTQYSKTGIPLKSYDFIGLFPIALDPISLDWGANDQIEEFGVTFTYQYWTSSTTDS